MSLLAIFILSLECFSYMICVPAVFLAVLGSEGALFRKVNFNFILKPSFWILLSWGILFSVSWYKMYGSLFTSIWRYCVCSVLCFAIGYVVCTDRKNKCIDYSYKIIIAIAFGCGIHIILNLILNFGADRSFTRDFWLYISDKYSSYLAATNLGSVSTFIYSLIPFFVITKDLKIKFCGAVLTGLSLIYSFVLGTRTQLVMMIAVIAISMIVHFFEHNKERISKKKFIIRFIAIIVVPIMLVTLYTRDFLGIKTFVLNSNLINRLRISNEITRISDESRIYYLVQGISNLFNYPLGGVSAIRYYHNCWLDIGRVAGIFPVCVMLIYNAVTFFHAVKIFMQDDIREDIRYALVFIYIGIFANFFCEPIMDGYFNLWYRLCIVNGITEGIFYSCIKNKQTKKERKVKHNKKIFLSIAKNDGFGK